MRRDIDRRPGARLSARFLRLCGGLAILSVLVLGACGTEDSGGGDESTISDAGPVDAGPTDIAADGGGTDTFKFPDSNDTPDVLECPGGPGCGCAGNDDCDSAFCIEAPGGKECARHCVDSCSGDYACKTVNGPGGDPTTICVPKYARLCNPCTSSKECPGLGIADSACVDQGNHGGFCGVACTSDLGCPKDYACKDIKTVEGDEARLCVRKPLGDSKEPYGVCPCSPRATKLKLQTTCTVDKTEGGKKLVCEGVRSCQPTTDSPNGEGMLSACTANDPEKEVCDGQDNDCDGDVDEGSCDDGNACTSEVCAGEKGCAKQDLSGVDCTDSNACTDGDKCAKGICVPGAAKNCDDGNPCTKDACDMASGCTQTADDNKPCSDDNPCTLGDTCAAGSCKPGKDKECKVAKACLTASCNIADGKCAFENATTGKSCDDGDACTTDDGCASGVCVGAKKITCDDKNPCTDDFCDGKTGCGTKNNGAGCSDDNPCTVNDVCVGGKCKIGLPKECTSTNVCVTTSCSTDTGKCVFKDATTGKSCDDNDACTLDDGCEAGACKGGKKAVCDDKNPCTDDFCDGKTGCGTKHNTAACDDGNGCTVNDTCEKGGCKAGGPKNCDDGNACTEGEKCIASGKDAGKCSIGTPKKCNDGNVCTDDSCDAKKGCIAKPKYSGACDADGTPCTVNDACDAGVCKAGAKKACDDKNPCTKGTCNPDTGKCFFLPLPDKTPCGKDGAQCKLATCIPGCKKEHERKCHKGSVWWFDSCGKEEKVAEACTGFTFCKLSKCNKGVVDGNYKMTANPSTQTLPLLGKVTFAPVIMAVKDWGPFVQGDFGVGGQKVQMTGKLVGNVWTPKGSYTQAGTLTITHTFNMNVTFKVDPSNTGKPLPDLFTGTVIDSMTVSGLGSLGAVTWNITGKKQ